MLNTLPYPDIWDRTLIEILQHAESSYPNEACGVVLRSMQVVRMQNKAHDPRINFMLDPVEYSRLEKDVLLVYHSHPDRVPEPTEPDKASSEACGKPYLIVSWPGKEVARYVPCGFKPKLEGRPFVYGIFDCYALVKDWFGQAEVEIPDFIRPPYGWWKDTDEDLFDKQARSSGFERVLVDSDLQRGDVISMMLGECRVPNHLAVYLGDGLMLHHSLFKLSGVGVYGGYWRKSTTGVYRCPLL